MKSLAAAAMLLGPILHVGPVNAAATVVSHRAFYEMELGSVAQNANIQAISGRSAFTLMDECDGWRSSEDYVIEFGGNEGSLDRIVSQFRSWESDDGDKYSFEIDEKSTFKGNQSFNGFAVTNADDGEAYFSMASDVAVELPKETYFPMQHLHKIISHAASGKKILSASVFTGAEPDEALMSTNTVIGSWNEDRAAGLLGAFSQDGFWPVQVAYFKPKAQVAEPEYEINYSMQANGVVRRYEIDYGGFTVVARLVTIEPVEKPVCK